MALGAQYEENQDGHQVKTTVYALSDQIDKDLIDKIEDNVCAMVTDADGNTSYLDCVVTIRELPQTKAADGVQYSMEVSTYADEVKVKTGSGNYNTSTVACSATITMEWIDRFGFNNSIERLFGEATFSRGNMRGGRVRWGDSRNQLVDIKTLTGDGSSFDFDPDYDKGSDGIPLSGSLYADYQLDFDGDGSYDLTVSASPAIWE